MLVWAFSGPSATAPTNEEVNDDATTEETIKETDEEASDTENGNTDEQPVEEAPALEIGEGSIDVKDQPASSKVALDGAVYPVNEGWVGVREYNDGNLGWILGAVRFSESASIVPTAVTLQRPTTAGKEYAIVIFTEDGDAGFNLATDVQIDKVFGTFTAQ